MLKYVGEKEFLCQYKKTIWYEIKKTGKQHAMKISINLVQILDK